jgi:hypothetical protein
MFVSAAAVAAAPPIAAPTQSVPPSSEIDDKAILVRVEQVVELLRTRHAREGWTIEEEAASRALVYFRRRVEGPPFKNEDEDTIEYARHIAHRRQRRCVQMLAERKDRATKERVGRCRQEAVARDLPKAASTRHSPHRTAYESNRRAACAGRDRGLHRDCAFQPGESSSEQNDGKVWEWIWRRNSHPRSAPANANNQRKCVWPASTRLRGSTPLRWMASALH